MDRSERVLYIVIAIIFAVAFIMALDMNPKISTYPKLVSGLGCVLSLSLVARTYIQEREMKKDPEAYSQEKDSIKSKKLTSKQWKIMFTSLGIILAYVLGIFSLGYVVSSLAFMIGMMSYIKGKARVLYVVIAGLFVGTIYAVFWGFLHIPLPRGILF